MTQDLRTLLSMVVLLSSLHCIFRIFLFLCAVVYWRLWKSLGITFAVRMG